MKVVFLIVICLFFSESLISQKVYSNCTQCNALGGKKKLGRTSEKPGYAKKYVERKRKCKVCYRNGRDYTPVYNCRCDRGSVGRDRYVWVSCKTCNGKGTFRNYKQEERNKKFAGKDYKLESNNAYRLIKHLKVLEKDLVVSKRIMRYNFWSSWDGSISYFPNDSISRFSSDLLMKFNVCSCVGPGWRIPTVYELDLINDLTYIERATDNFNSGTDKFYWSSTKNKYSKDDKYRFYLKTMLGLSPRFPVSDRISNWSIRSGNAYIKCVKGENITPTYFTDHAYLTSKKKNNSNYSIQKPKPKLSQYKPAMSLESVASGRGSIRKGEKGNSIVLIQSFLKMYKTTGIYDDETFKRVKNFQTQNNIVPDNGIIGPETALAIFKALNISNNINATSIGENISKFENASQSVVKKPNLNYHNTKNTNALSDITIEAENYLNGNVKILKSGKVTYVSDPGVQENYVEYKFDIPKTGNYAIEFRYAAAKSRPAKLIIDGNKKIRWTVMHRVTGGWSSEYQKWHRDFLSRLFTKGNHTLRIDSKPLMSHLDKIRIIHVPGKVIERCYDKFGNQTKCP